MGESLGFGFIVFVSSFVEEYSFEEGGEEPWGWEDVGSSLAFEE